MWVLRVMYSQYRSGLRCGTCGITSMAFSCSASNVNIRTWPNPTPPRSPSYSKREYDAVTPIRKCKLLDPQRVSLRLGSILGTPSLDDISETKVYGTVHKRCDHLRTMTTTLYRHQISSNGDLYKTRWTAPEWYGIRKDTTRWESSSRGL